jgi:hypothetical protein
MTNKALIGQFLKLFELQLEASSYFLVHPGVRSEETDHHVLSSGLVDGPADEARVSFMQHINDTVLINIPATFADLTAAGRADTYFFCHRLPACATEFHGNLFSIEWLMVRSSLF